MPLEVFPKTFEHHSIAFLMRQEVFRNRYTLLTKHEVKMAGCWLSSFFWQVKDDKKEQGQYPAILTKQAWSIKDSLYGQKITPKNFTFAGRKQAQVGKIGPSFLCHNL